MHVLANELRDGLVLALKLGLPDSMVTGIGFDALSEGLSLVEVTYRILLLWKRRTSREKDQIEHLADALEQLGRSDLAEMILDHGKQNAEINQACVAEYRFKKEKQRDLESKNNSTDDNEEMPLSRMVPPLTTAAGALQSVAANRHFLMGICQAKRIASMMREEDSGEGEGERGKKANGEHHAMADSNTSSNDEMMVHELVPPGSQQQQHQHQPGGNNRQSHLLPEIYHSQQQQQQHPLPSGGMFEFRTNSQANNGVQQHHPRLIGIENGPLLIGNPIQNARSGSAYLSKLAPIFAVEQSAEMTSQKKSQVVKRVKAVLEADRIDLAIGEEPRPTTPSSDVSQISL